ncbi:O-antigen ligase family protein [Bradyrhizobium liaoningense]|uniref:O-antigen ligase family protein n=1 Tax=Bradyrhizobium liaoningense TaxID=43992 RepID=UPI001BA660A4|nr:O-antigen ligase family protein [Bradyrhizobium liaoningense]MBR0713024.1 hypothetical protein [Bradyrhizobium liaoningense]
MVFRDRWRWLALAIFASSSSILVLAHGLLAGGSGTTATILILSTAGLFLVADCRSIEHDFCDFCFVAFAGYVALSVALHPLPDFRELVLLALALLCYPAGRLFKISVLDSIFPTVTLAIATIGCIAVLTAFLNGNISPLGKPEVFGELAAAPTQFMLPYVLAVGMLLVQEKIAMDWRVAALIAALAAIYAAAMVRFTFVAALGAGAVLAVARSWAIRRRIIIAGLMLVAAIAIGQVSRLSTALKFGGMAAYSIRSGAPIDPNCAHIELFNSIEVRKTLYRDWLRLILGSNDLTGIGLDGFMKHTCYPENEVHNDVLQVALEFGWPAAGLFVFLIAMAFVRLARAMSDERARFGLFALSFLVLMSMAHGRVSRDYPLFFFIGYAMQFAASAAPRATKSAAETSI